MLMALMSHRSWTALLQAAALLTLVACTEGPRHAPSTAEIVATVGERHITAVELDHVLPQGSIGVEAEPTVAARRRTALTNLVQMEAMAQLAMAQGWHEDPAFEIDAQMATRRALAAEAERRTLRRLPPPTPEQIRRFIDDNRPLFGARQWFTIEELSLPAPAPLVMAALDSAVRNGASLEVLEGLLRGAQLVPTRRVRGAGTEQLPPALGKALLSAGLGKPLVLRPMPDRLTVAVLRGVMPAPIGDAEAQRIAYGVLQDLQRRRAAQQQIQQAMDAVSIEYHGAFATTADTAGAAPTATLAALPAGRPASARQTVGDKIMAAVGMAVGAAFITLTLLMAIRHAIGRLWLPRDGFQSTPAPLPLLTDLLEADHQNGPYATHPSFWSRLGLFLLWFAWMVGLMGLSGLVLRDSGVLGLEVTAASLAVGLLLGLLAAHAFARSPWRARTRSHTWLPVLVLALVWLGLNAGLLLVTQQ